MLEEGVEHGRGLERRPTGRVLGDAVARLLAVGREGEGCDRLDHLEVSHGLLVEGRELVEEGALIPHGEHDLGLGEVEEELLLDLTVVVERVLVLHLDSVHLVFLSKGPCTG